MTLSRNFGDRRRFVTALAFALVTGFLPQGVAAQEPQPVRVTEQGVVLDFQNAELRLVISALAEAGGLNVVYGDLPNRRVTLRLTQPVPISEIAELLRNVAESNGLVMQDVGGILRIVAEGGEVGGPARGPVPQEAGAPSGAPRLYVYRLRHVPAARLASTLQSLFGGATGAAPRSGLSRPPLSEQMRGQRIYPDDMEALRPRADVEVAVGAATVAIPAQLEGEVQIVADELTNSLLVRATPGDWGVIGEAIEALDLRPLQVLIEVLIAEVRRDRTFDVGLRAITRADVDDEGQVTFRDRVGGALLGETTGNILLELQNLGNIDIDVAISALSANGRVRILSRPVLLAQNNLEARILVGSERPFVQVFRSLPTESATRDQIVQYRDVGTQLTILPTINPDGYVNLQVVQEVSNATSESQFGAPIISTREASTSLFVRDGETAVIGGLIDHQTERTRSGIPLLKDIPVLGWLFGSTRDNTISTELFLFLTPHIVRSDDDLRRVGEAVDERAEMVGEALEENPPIFPDARTTEPGNAAEVPPAPEESEESP